MTKRQRKLCKDISKYKNLSTVLMKNNLDYLEIQDILGAENLSFSDYQMDNNTTITISDELKEELIKYRRYIVDVWITRIVAVWGGITGTIALIVQLMQLFLSQPK